MTIRYLLDTNILLRACDPAASSYALALEAIARLLAQGEECVITPQVLIEFWVVATRPIAVNGLGWNAEQTHTEVEQILDQFTLLTIKAITLSPTPTTSNQEFIVCTTFSLSQTLQLPIASHPPFLASPKIYQ